MKFKKNNTYWQMRSKHGRDKIFATPEDLWEAATEFFQWCDDNPIPEEKLFHYQGKITTGTLHKQRPYTLGALTLFLGVGQRYLYDLTPDFSQVIARIRETCYQQKFAGAVADQMNANIIARDLGLIDKKEIGGGISVGVDPKEITFGLIQEDGTVTTT